MNKILVLIIIILLPQFLYLTTRIEVAVVSPLVLLILLKSLNGKKDNEGKYSLLYAYNLNKKWGIIKFKGHLLEIIYTIIFIIFTTIDLSKFFFKNYNYIQQPLQYYLFVILLYIPIGLLFYRFLFLNILNNNEKYLQ